MTINDICVFYSFFFFFVSSNGVYCEDKFKKRYKVSGILEDEFRLSNHLLQNYASIIFKFRNKVIFANKKFDRIYLIEYFQWRILKNSENKFH